MSASDLLGAQVPLFPGDCELQQLLHIFKLLGTPTEETWPGIGELKDWHDFPRWRPTDLALTFPQLEASGVDLMQRMFIYNPAERLSVRPLPAALLVARGVILVQHVCTRSPAERPSRLRRAAVGRLACSMECCKGSLSLPLSYGAARRSTCKTAIGCFLQLATPLRALLGRQQA